MKKEPFLYAISFTGQICISTLALSVPLLALSIGGTYDDLGGLGAAGSVAYTLSCFAVGRWSDRVGYRRLMALSTGVLPILYLGYLIVDRVWQLFLIAVLIGPAMAAFWPCVQAWLGQGNGRRQLLGFLGRFNVAWAIGALLGPVVAGVLHAASPHLAYVLVSAVTAIVFISLLLVRIRDQPTATEDDDGGHSLAAARRFLPIAWTANFATFYTLGTVRSLFPKLGTDLSLGPELIGYIMSLVGLGQVVTFLLLSRTDRWQFRLAPLAVLQLVAVASLAGFTMTSSSLFFALGMLVSGVLIGATFTASIFYSLHARGPGGRRASIHEGVVGTGVFLGPLVGGLVAEHVSARAPYLVAMAVLMGALAIEVYLLWRSRPERTGVPV